MKKQIILLIMFGIFCLTNLAMAVKEPFGVFANHNKNSIQIINPDTRTASSAVGLEGGSGLTNVAITSDGKTVIANNPDTKRVHFGSISRSGGVLKYSHLGGMKFHGLAPSSIAITPDDKYVFLTDGSKKSTISIVETSTGKLVHSRSFGDHNSHAIAISPTAGGDGRYIVMTLDKNKVHIFKFSNPTSTNPTPTLEFSKSLDALGTDPVNIAISPDGYTAIAVSGKTHRAPVFEIETDSRVVRANEPDGYVGLPFIGGQSAVYSPIAGRDKVYYLSTSEAHRAQILTLDVVDPPPFRLKFSGHTIKARPGRGSTDLLVGVNTMAIEPNGNYLYVSNPSLTKTSNRISIIDLTAGQQIGYIQAEGIPTGIAFSEFQE